MILNISIAAHLVWLYANDSVYPRIITVPFQQFSGAAVTGAMCLLSFVAIVNRRLTLHKRSSHAEISKYGNFFASSLVLLEKILLVQSAGFPFDSISEF